MIYENQESTTNKNPGYQQMSTPSSFQMITWQNATTTCSLVHLHTLWVYIRGRYLLLKDDQITDDEENIAHLHFTFLSASVIEIPCRVVCHLIRAGPNRIAARFELMGESQRDFTPELAAQQLRACSDVHYLQ